ncbi:reticulocalbin-2 [Neodiprion pinetum]|uniref:Reticulocalbin-2 n=1 Tax=Neodiprion lecontei TaxID=441921 RepID=A0A6J0BW79_NEOLC|nr:reticulocalbin-2 [Neodiprion lecontei]XP_046419031.1 reticulocalbin-2 [Neodiprion fabricii]XP_046474396.1 reticulocalbin-2 [Neodiprion pinetum]XP_046612634.1 reticulocalbin-2 [Neodiprion virginianus]
MVKLKLRQLLIVGICLFREILTTEAASAHIHTHHSNKDAASHERTEDGAFSPRDVEHYADGDHHQEFDHEAILGSVKQAEEFDKLPPETAKERLGILLTKMDLNNDQYIERNELKAWILRSFSMLSTEESEDRLDDADANEDGRVSWDEILQDTYGSDPEDLAEDDKLIQDDKATFNAADLDGDGYLDADEFKAYTHPEETARMFPLLLQQALDDKDTDKDGFISFQEFLGDRARGEDKEWLLVEKDKFDHDYDKNGDGRLDSEEILAWLVPSNEDIATQESDHLFAASDDDHDDRLSFEEILDHHDVFVGSEATDYGEHLHNIENFKDEL